MTWDELDWPALDRLRGKFLSAAAGGGPYWTSPDDLASYDFTYGERIGWKWDQVIRELKLRDWQPAARDVLDWGCGSGIAGRRLIKAFGPENFDALTVWDRSPVACDFATAAAQAAFPSLRSAQATPSFLESESPIGLLLISHVLNELPPDALAGLRQMIARADEIIWVEPGTHVVSRQLGALREELGTRFRVVAPCTHTQTCPILQPGNERHWCHHFAPPPSEIFADSNWVKFGQRAGIDLRSLPYAFLAMDRRFDRAPHIGLSRIIGRPEHFKPYARVLNCDASGLATLELPKRADAALFKQLERTKSPLVYRWRREGAKLLGGKSLATETPES